jgi:tRNA A37 threonylcarbamoyltransferase TsaD
MNTLMTIKHINNKALEILKKYCVNCSGLDIQANTQVENHPFYLIKANIKDKDLSFSGIGASIEAVLKAFESNIQKNRWQISVCPPIVKSLTCLPQN